MNFQERINNLLNLNIEYGFCPPSSEEYPTGEIYVNKAILNNSDLEEAERNMVTCEEKSVLVKEEFDKEIAAREKRSKEIAQIRQAINLIEESNKPNWEKKLLKRLVLELKE